MQVDNRKRSARLHALRLKVLFHPLFKFTFSPAAFKALFQEPKVLMNVAELAVLLSLDDLSILSTEGVCPSRLASAFNCLISLTLV